MGVSPYHHMTMAERLNQRVYPLPRCLMRNLALERIVHARERCSRIVCPPSSTPACIPNSWPREANGTNARAWPLGAVTSDLSAVTCAIATATGHRAHRMAAGDRATTSHATIRHPITRPATPVLASERSTGRVRLPRQAVGTRLHRSHWFWHREMPIGGVRVTVRTPEKHHCHARINQSTMQRARDHREYTG